MIQTIFKEQHPNLNLTRKMFLLPFGDCLLQTELQTKIHILAEISEVSISQLLPTPRQ